MNVYLCRQCHDNFHADVPRGDATEGYLCSTCWGAEHLDEEYEPAPVFDGGARLFAEWFMLQEEQAMTFSLGQLVRFVQPDSPFHGRLAHVTSYWWSDAPPIVTIRLVSLEGEARPTLDCGEECLEPSAPLSEPPEYHDHENPSCRCRACLYNKT